MSISSCSPHIRRRKMWVCWKVQAHAVRLREEIEELKAKLEGTIVEGVNDAMQEISDDLGELLDLEAEVVN